MPTAREMGNVILLWDDAASDGTTTIHTHSTETSGYVAESLLDTDRQTCFMTTATGTVLVSFNLQSPQTIKYISIHNHNMSTKTCTTFDIYRSADGSAWTLVTSWPLSDIGNDDFMVPINGGTGLSYQYWKLEFTGTDAGFYLGRVFLARSYYELPKGIAVGSEKGYLKNESVILTPGSIEHRMSKGPKRRVLRAMIPSAETAVRDQIAAMVDSCDVNDKCFVMSWPGGTTLYTGVNRYGAAVHARLNVEAWLYAMKWAGLTDLPLDAVEVL